MDTKKLRQKILDLAIHGKLVPQDPDDEPASVLLERIRAEKERLVKEGKIKKNKASKTTDTPHYENVPFEIPSSWEWCKLGDVVSFLGGFAYKSNTYVSSSNWQVIRIGNVKNDNLLLDNQPIFVSEEIGKDTQKYLIKTDDILFSMTGTKGKRDYFFSVVVPQLNKKLLLNQRVGCLRKFSKDINIHYLCLALKGQYVLDAIFSTETGNVSQGNIGSESTLNLNIALPPLPEQIRIVKEVKRLFALIDQIEQGKVNLQTTIKQAKSKILNLAIHGKLVPQNSNDEPASELLKRINPKAEITCDNGLYGKVPNGWRVCKLNDLCSKIFAGGDKPAICTKDFTKENSIPIYANSVENEGLYGYTNQAIVNVPSITISARGTIGFVCVRTQPFVPIVRLITIIPYKDICLEYLSYALQACILTIEGSSIPQLTVPTFKENQIPLPPLAEQHRIVTKIEELFSLLDNIQESLEV